MCNLKNLKNHIPIFVSFIIAITVLIITATNTLISYDTYWHLATGRDFLEYGDSPFFDHFSFTHYGNKINPSPVIFQIIIASFVSLFGLVNGYFLFKLCVYLLFLCATYFFYKINKIHYLAILLTLPFIVYFFIQRGENVRPEIISYVFLMITLTLYFKTIKDFSSKNLFLISILLIVWCNYHNPIFGYIIIFGLFLEKGIFKLEKKESFSWLFYCLWALFIFLIGFVNLNYQHFIFSQLKYTHEWKYLISEYGTLGTYYSLFFSTVFFSLSVVLSFWLFKTKQYGMLIICVLTVSQTWQIVRLLAFSGIIISSLYSLFLTDLIQKHQQAKIFNFKFIRLTKSHYFSLILLLVIASHAFLLYNSYSTYQSINNKEPYFPVKITHYLKQTQTSGNIYNPFYIGGYLSYHLSKGFKTYIDGRTVILFSLDFLKKHYRTLHSPLLLKKEVEKYNINYAILENNTLNYELIYSTEIFSIDYASKYFFLATTGIGNFPITGNLLIRPSCWKQNINPKLLLEIKKGQKILPKDSPLREIQQHLKAFSNSTNKHLYLKNLLHNKKGSVYTKRTIAYLALQEGFIGESILLFDTLKTRIPTDMMAIATAFIKNKQYEDAYNILLAIKPKTVDEQQTIGILYKFLSQQKGLKIDKGILLELNNVKFIDETSLQKILCMTRTIPGL